MSSYLTETERNKGRIEHLEGRVATLEAEAKLDPDAPVDTGPPKNPVTELSKAYDRALAAEYKLEALEEWAANHTNADGDTVSGSAAEFDAIIE